MKNNRSNLLILVIVFIMIATLLTVTTYTYLTDMGSGSLFFTIDRVQLNCKVEGNVVVNNLTTEDVDDLAYVHIKDDVVLDKYNLLGKMASEIKLELSFNNAIKTRPHLKIDEEEGLLFFIIKDDDPNRNVLVKTENGIIKWQYENDPEWNDIIDLSAYLTVPSSTTYSDLDQNVRTKFNEYNYNFLKNNYLNTLLSESGTINYRIIFWGDYYNLTNKDEYLTKTFNLNLNIRIIQAIDQYGGTLDYEQD